MLHIDIDPTSISKTVPADVPIVGDARRCLTRCLICLSREESQQPLDEIRDWWQQIEQWRSRHCLQYDTQSGKIKPQAVIEAIWRLTNGDAYVTSDVGQHQMFAALYYPFDKPRRWINSGGLGTMGFWPASGAGREDGATARNRDLRDRRWQHPDEHSGSFPPPLQYELPVLVLNPE